jgi:DnaJ-class molecular chaperone
VAFFPNNNACGAGIEVAKAEGSEKSMWCLLQEARDVLTDPEKKTLYDKWRGSGIAIGFKQWMSMKDSVQQVEALFNTFM